MLLIIFIVIFSTMLLYYIHEQLQTRRMCQQTKDIPGPKNYPFIGGSLEFGTNSIAFLKNLERLTAEHGPVFKVWLGMTLTVTLSDAKDIEAVLNNTLHLNKNYIYDFLNKWLGTGLVTASATKWKTQKKVLNPAFHVKILESYIDIFNANVTIMMKLLEKELGKERFDIGPYVDKCTLDIICETAMATSVHAQLNEDCKITKALKVLSNSVMVRSFSPWLFPELMFNLSSVGREYNKQLKYINSFIDYVIAQKKKVLTESKSNGILPSGDSKRNENDLFGLKKRYVFLDLLLLYAEDPSVHMTEQDIRDEVNTFMFGGHDTTAATIGFIIYMLGSHLDVQAKVLNEILNVFDGTDREPTYSDLCRLKYMEQVIKETLRIYSSIPLIGRRLHKDITLPSGYTLPTGTSVNILLFQLHRDPNLFPDPQKFDPDRFDPDRPIARSAFAYLPFSGGPRNCIGQKFAMLEIKATMVKLLKTYKVFAVSPEPFLASELVLRSRNGINVKLEKRN